MEETVYFSEYSRAICQSCTQCLLGSCRTGVKLVSLGTVASPAIPEGKWGSKDHQWVAIPVFLPKCIWSIYLDICVYAQTFESGKDCQNSQFTGKIFSVLLHYYFKCFIIPVGFSNKMNLILDFLHISSFFLIHWRSIFFCGMPSYANAITIFAAHFKWFVYIIYQLFFWVNLNSGGFLVGWLTVFGGGYVLFFLIGNTASKCKGIFSQHKKKSFSSL